MIQCLSEPTCMMYPQQIATLGASTLANASWHSWGYRWYLTKLITLFPIFEMCITVHIWAGHMFIIFF
jgi:hypothetical protein